MKNFYEVLQVRTNATQMQIKRAYIDLMTKYHPDVYKGDKVYAQRYTSVITEAYAVLKDEEKRRLYDEKHDISSKPNFRQLRREDKYIIRAKKAQESPKQNYAQAASMEYFKNTSRKKPRKEGSLLKRIFTSKLFYGILALIIIEVGITLFLYFR